MKVFILRNGFKNKKEGSPLGAPFQFKKNLSGIEKTGVERC
jgi:hypothetical protein